ncbi:MAG: tetratricopeptide repeat protein [Fidelibacterota bacterium]|nr:MAG: tetratricopeptide repeat protein [Candidatus Neomarinimicrobiota bacterium]
MADKKQQGELTIAGMVEQYSGLAVRIFGFVAGAVGLLYGIGFAVVNISLLRYGVYEVSLVRARYVSTGVFYLVFFVLLALGVRLSLFLVERRVIGRSWTSLALSAIPIGVICCVLTLGVWEFKGLLNFLSHFVQCLKGADPASVWKFGGLFSVHFLLWCLGVSFFVLLIMRRDQIPWLRDLLAQADISTEGVPSGAERKPKTRAASLVVWSLVGISVLVSFYYYGHSAYATFPPALGGGLPIVVQFSGEEESMAILERLGIDREASGLTRKVTLIVQTDTRYIVLVRDPVLERDVAVSFEKSFVHGIRYYPDEYYLSDEYAADKHTRDGKAYLEGGKLDAAVAEFKEALWRVPGYIPALVGKGDAQLALGNREEAIQSYEKALDYDESVAAAHYGLARAYALSEQAKQAVDSLRKAIDADETYREKAKTEAAFEAIKPYDDFLFLDLVFQGLENAAFWYGQAGDGQRGDGNWEAAVVEYTWAISLTHQIENKTGEADYRYRRAGVYLELDEDQDALKDYNEAVKLDPTNATYRFGLAEAYAAQEDFLSALVEYKEARTINPDYIAAWVGEGEAYLVLGQDYDLAVESYTAAIALDRDNGMAYYGRARAGALLGMRPEAMRDLRRAIILDPNYMEKADLEPAFDGIREEVERVLSAAQRNQKGNLLVNEGKLEEAINEYLAALELDPTGAAYHANLGDVYRKLQQPGDAAEHYQLAVEYDPENDSYHYRLAGVYYDQGDFDLAIEEYEKAVEFNDKNPVYHGGLGDAYRQEGRLDEAAGAYARAIELDESNASYHARLADIYQRQGDLEGAVTEYSEAIRLYDDNPAYHYGLAQAYRAQNKLQEALQSYQAAIQRNPEYGDAYCGLGLAYQKSKQRQNAIEALEQCQAVSQDEELIEQARKALAELEGQ